MDHSIETKMEILDAIADMDPVYQLQLRQLMEKEKRFDQMIGALSDEQRAVAWEFVMLCEDMCQRKQQLACQYMKLPVLIGAEESEQPDKRKLARKVMNSIL